MRRASLAALTLAGAAGIHAAPAQEVALESSAGPRTSPRGSRRASRPIRNYDLDDPSPGTSYYGDTRFALGYLNETPTQSFALGLDTGLRALWRAEEDFEFIVASPSLGYVAYAQEGVDTALRRGLPRCARARWTRPATSATSSTRRPGPACPTTSTRAQDDTRELRYDADVGLVLGTDLAQHLRVRAWTAPPSTIPTRPAPAWCRASQVEGSALWTLRLTPVFSAALVRQLLLLHRRRRRRHRAQRGRGRGRPGLRAGRERCASAPASAMPTATARAPIGTGERQTIQDDSGIDRARRHPLPAADDFTLIGNAPLDHRRAPRPG